MARAQYGSWLYVWDDGDNPGAGDKAVDSTGLNGNWIKIADAFQEEHNTPGGTHKDGFVKRVMLDGTTADKVCDGYSVEKDVTTGLRVKAYAVSGDGIQYTHLNPNVADGSTIEKDASVGLRVKDLGITGAKLAAGIVDSSTIEISSGVLRVKDDGITPAKMPHDNNRTKVLLGFYFGTGDTVPGLFSFDGCPQTAILHGYVMTRAGSITGVATFDGSSSLRTMSSGYGTYTFALGDRLRLYLTATSSGQVQVYKNGSSVFSTSSPGTWTLPISGTIEVEFDD